MNEAGRARAAEIHRWMARFGEVFAILFQSSALTVKRSSVEFRHRFKEIDSTTN
jgi:hypothetical protein